MQIDVIGVPLDFGAGRRGVDMGPSAIRYAGLCPGLAALAHEVSDLGNLAVPVAETCVPGDPHVKYLEPIVDVARRLAAAVANSIAQGHVPLVLGGDHSLSLGSIAGAARDRQIGLVWLDAHGDFNTPATTPSGNIHGMPLATLLGYGDERLRTLNGLQGAGPKLDPHHVVLVGTRDLDNRERELLEQAGATVFSMETIDRRGICETMERARDLAGQARDGIWLSLDIDGVDPTFAPGVGTAVPGGLTFREAHLAVELLGDTGRLIGMDLVEVNPILDRENQTGALAVKLALSAFGKRIWRLDEAVAAGATVAQVGA
ncbi:MAG: arginase [Herpetosiphonaceae bacterium]|nr:arginase [Herpetosiphonaceae bacterium]